MPCFELDDLSTPDGRWWTAHRLLCVVLFPDDPTEQSRYMAAIGAFCLIHPALPAEAAASETARPSGGAIPVSHGSAAGVLMRHGGPRVAYARGFDTYHDLIRRSRGKAFMAGALLTLLYRLALHPEFRERASINMAAYVLEKKQPFPDIMAANRKDIYAAWTRYKPVAHICGALLNLQLSAMRAHDAEEERNEFIIEYLFERTQEFVELATVFQSFGLGYRLHRAKARTPLDIENLYRLPPLGQQASENAVLPLSERLVETARQYQAQKRWSG